MKKLVLSCVLFVSVLNGAAVPAFARAEPVSMCQGIFAGAVDRESRVPVPSKYNPVAFYWSKLKELQDLNRSTPYAVILRGLIQSTTTEVERVLIPLRSLKPIHLIDREEASRKLQERIAVLRQVPVRGPKLVLTSDLLEQCLPSKNAIRVIQADTGEFVVFDGNGRFMAIKEAFDNEMTEVEVEVEVYRSNSKALQAVLKRLREVRGVLDYN